MKLLIVAATWLSALTQTALAYDFSAADALFARRAESPAVAEEARLAFRRALDLPDLTPSEKIYAVEQHSRLSFYQALSFDTNNDKIKRVAMECYDTTRFIENKTGKSPIQYYYWRGACLAGWARANGVLQSMMRAQEIKDLVDGGLSLSDLAYEGGGMFRLAAALYMRLPEHNPLGGPTGSLELAFQYSTKALNSLAYAGAAFPETSTGDYFFQIYEVRGEILWRTGHRDEALKTLRDAIKRAQEGDVSPDRIPESSFETRDCGKLIGFIERQ